MMMMMMIMMMFIGLSLVVAIIHCVWWFSGLCRSLRSLLFLHQGIITSVLTLPRCHHCLHLSG